MFSAIDAAVRRVHQAERGGQWLVIAFAPGLRVSAAVRAFTASHPEVQIELRRVSLTGTMVLAGSWGDAGRGVE